MRLVRVAVTVLLVGTSLLAHLQAYGRWDVMPPLWAGAGVVYQDPVANSWNYFKNLEAIKAIQYPNEVPFHDFTCAWSTHQVYCRIWTNGYPAGSGSGYYSSGYNVWCDNSQGWYPIQGSGTWDGPPPWPCLKKVVDSAPNPAKNAGNPPSCQGVFNPINSGTGNKVQQEIDYTDGAPLPLELVRSYNSQRSSGAATMGWNWRHGFERFLWRAGNVLVFMYRPDGRALQFDLINGAWRPESDAVGALTEVAGGYQYVNDRNQIENYDSAGRLTILVEPSGRSQKFEYTNGTTIPPLGARALDANGNPTTNAVVAGRLLNVADEFGRRIEFSYDLAGRMLRMTAPAGEIYQYAYDASNNLASVTYPDGKVRTYHYNEAAYTGGANLPNALTGLTDENGARFAIWGYDAQGRAISSEHAGGVERGTLQYGASNTVVTDPLGTQRTYNFTTILGVVKKTGQSQPGGAGCGPATNAITYDANGNIASRTDFNGNQTRYTYDLARNVETQRVEGYGQPEARTVSTQWHAYWRQPVAVAEPLKLSTYVYNGDTYAGQPVTCAPAGALVGTQPIGVLCRKIEQATADATGAQGFAATPAGTPREWRYAYSQYGQVLTADDPRTDMADVTTYTYYLADDADLGKRGNLATATNALGQATQVTAYDAHGHPLTIVDPNGLTTQLTYDPRGRLTSRSLGGEATQYGYDAAGQLTRVTLPDGAYLAYTYDPAHRLIGIADNLGNSIAYTLDAAGNRLKDDVKDPLGALAQTRSRVFDALSRLAQDIGAGGQTTGYGYDPNGNLITLTDPLSRVTTHGYDALNRLIRVTDPGDGQTRYAHDGQGRVTQVTDPRNLATDYTVDGLGNLTRELSPDTGSIQRTYDAAGNVLTRTDAKGQVTTYQYDALNRLTQATYADGSQVRYTYDAPPNGIGRLTRIEEVSGGVTTGAIQYGYDPQGRIVAETRTVDGVAANLAYRYAAGRLAGLTYPSGRQVDYTRDALGRVAEVRLTDSGQVKVLASAIQYQPFGGVKRFTNGAGQTYTRGFDQDGRIASYSLATQTWIVGYDGANRIGFQTDAANAAASYGYDAVDRLTSAVLPAASHGYTYDATGNRVTQSAGGITRNYAVSPTSNRLQGIDSAPPKTYSYDANGALTGDGANQYGYDARGRMASAATAAGTTQYRVNALGQRVRKSGAAGETVFHYDQDGRLIAEATAQGQITREYIYLNDIPLAVLQ